MTRHLLYLENIIARGGAPFCEGAFASEEEAAAELDRLTGPGGDYEGKEGWIAPLDVEPCQDNRLAEALAAQESEYHDCPW